MAKKRAMRDTPVRPHDTYPHIQFLRGTVAFCPGPSLFTFSFQLTVTAPWQHYGSNGRPVHRRRRLQQLYLECEDVNMGENRGLCLVLACGNTRSVYKVVSVQRRRLT